MKIAITGGIGSGKSYVCRILEKQGIKVYDCDAEAKRLMSSDADLQAGLKRLVGDEVYNAEGILQKPVLAQFLLASEENKQAVNDVWCILPWQEISSRAITNGWRVPFSLTVVLTVALILILLFALQLQSLSVCSAS